MGSFSVFMASKTGKILAGMLLFVGLADIAIANILFGKLVREAEAKISPAMSPEQAKPLQAQLRAKQILKQAITGTGAAFVLFGLFGLTR